MAGVVEGLFVVEEVEDVVLGDDVILGAEVFANVAGLCVVMRGVVAKWDVVGDGVEKKFVVVEGVVVVVEVVVVNVVGVEDVVGLCVVNHVGVVKNVDDKAEKNTKQVELDRRYSQSDSVIQQCLAT